LFLLSPRSWSGHRKASEAAPKSEAVSRSALLGGTKRRSSRRALQLRLVGGANKAERRRAPGAGRPKVVKRSSARPDGAKENVAVPQRPSRLQQQTEIAIARGPYLPLATADRTRSRDRENGYSSCVPEFDLAIRPFKKRPRIQLQRRRSLFEKRGNHKRKSIGEHIQAAHARWKDET